MKLCGLPGRDLNNFRVCWVRSNKKTWIWAFAGMTDFKDSLLQNVMPAKAGIQCW